jgi:hypothetical protein
MSNTGVPDGTRADEPALVEGEDVLASHLRIAQLNDLRAVAPNFDLRSTVSRWLATSLWTTANLILATS